MTRPYALRAVAPAGRRLSQVPDALASWEELAGLVRNRRPVLCFDFDGTLAAIVDDPDAAVLVDGARTVLARLAAACPVAVISGRDLDDVRRRVALDGLWYAGNHGFELQGPHGEDHEHGAARNALPALEHAAADLQDRLARIPGAMMERKRFAITVHHRNVDEDRVGDVVAAVDDIGSRHDGLRVTRGRRVTELRPDLAWDKGRALAWLLERVVADEATLPVYAGDDLTDEDALEVVRAVGLGIVVRSGEHGDRPTAAHVAVDDPEELCRLLERLANLMERDA